MKNIHTITLTSALISSLLQSAAPKVAIPDAKVSIPTPKTFTAPKAQPIIQAKTNGSIPAATVSAPPIAKVMTPSVAVAPKTIVPVTPSAKQIAAPKTMPVATAKTPTATPFVKAAPFTIKLPVQINIKNTSNFSAKLTGFTIAHKDKDGNNHLLSQTIPNTKFVIAPASAQKILPIEFKLKAAPGTFFVGTSAIFINGQELSTIYKKQPWNRGITDAIYVTSKNGTTWKIDMKAMNAAYQKLSKPNATAKASTKRKVTATTKAAAIPIMQEQNKSIKIAQSNKHSKSKNASAKAIKIS